MRKEAKIYVTVIILLTFICSCFLLTGCSAEASTSNDNFTTLYSSPTKNVYDYRKSAVIPLALAMGM